MKRYFGYIRVSTAKQGEKGSSLQEQQAAIESYARRHSLSIVEWFEEKETAAKHGRPVFAKMLAALEHGLATGVVTHKIDRSARNLRDWAAIGELIDRGVEMHFAHESIDLTSRGGRLSADIQAVVAADYVRNLRDEVRKGFYGRLKQGYWPLQAPLGYLDQGGGRAKIIDPVRGPVIVKAFELYATGAWTLKTISQELYTRGLRTKGGGRVTRNGVSSVLNNPFYIGLMRIEKTGEVFQGAHEPLIGKPLFDRVQLVLRGRTTHRATRYRFRYQRLFRCACCGHSLVAERQKGHVYYRCHTKSCTTTSLREDAINDVLRYAGSFFAFTDDELADIRADVETALAHVRANAGSEAQALALAVAAIDDRLGRLTDAYLDGVVDRETYSTRKEKLLGERTALTSRQLAFRSEPDDFRQRVEENLELLKALRNLPKLSTDEELRDVLKDATSNLQVRQKDLVITWANPFNRLATRDLVTGGGPQRIKLRTRAAALKNFVEYFSSQEFLTRAEAAPARFPTGISTAKQNAGQKNIAEFNRHRTRTQDGEMLEDGAQTA